MKYFLFLFITINLYSQDLPQVKLDFSSVVLSSEGKVIGYIGEKNRVDVKSTGNISKYVIWSLIATEDRDFYNHDGVSYKGLVRGIFKTLTGNTQGGSTITMQLARNLFLTNERSISRKLTEIDIAKKIERKYSKDQILLLYLNTVLFGHGIYGIWAASEEYFSKTPDKLSITESATLAGLLQNPGGYDPYVHPDMTLKRRNEVLYNLVEVGKISEQEFYKYKAMPLNLNLNAHIGKHFMEHVRKEALEIVRPFGLSLSKDQLKITTTLHCEIQKAAEEAIKYQWSGLPAYMKEAETGLIAIENGTGMIRAMIGGNPDSEPRGLNRTDEIKRQPGSSFKAFLYGSLIQTGSTLATPLLNIPLVVDSGKAWEWRPSNADEEITSGILPMETAIQHSINLCAAYAITNLTNPDSVVRFAHQLGIQSEIPPLPSIALGTADVSPLELASAYSVFGSEGVYAKPFSILKIEDRNGRVLYNGSIQSSVVLDSATSYLMTTALRTTVDGGTASTVRKYYKGFAAGKTGTTQNSTDAWFVGYNAKLTTAIWIGYDNPKRKLSGGFQYGGSACAPIWGRMMSTLSRYANWVTNINYTRPESIRDTLLCSDSGELATDKCLNKKVYPVNFDKLPVECTIHGTKKKELDIHYGW